jgi:predicted DNA-binding transcriptional regulator AlpA
LIGNSEGLLRHAILARILSPMSIAINRRQHEVAAMSALAQDQLLDIAEIAKIYRSTPGSIRTALWKHRKRGGGFRFPIPISGPGRLRWLRSVVDQHLQSLNSAELEAFARRCKPI